jgi:hypothetical protein
MGRRSVGSIESDDRLISGRGVEKGCLWYTTHGLNCLIEESTSSKVGRRVIRGSEITWD